ncbi:hypothetical protein ACA910_012921 [Epithemia clementina (nom. ined.)]
MSSSSVASTGSAVGGSLQMLTMDLAGDDDRITTNTGSVWRPPTPRNDSEQQQQEHQQQDGEEEEKLESESSTSSSWTRGKSLLGRLFGISNKSANKNANNNNNVTADSHDRTAAGSTSGDGHHDDCEALPSEGYYTSLEEETKSDDLRNQPDNESQGEVMGYEQLCSTNTRPTTTTTLTTARRTAHPSNGGTLRQSLVDALGVGRGEGGSVRRHQESLLPLSSSSSSKNRNNGAEHSLHADCALFFRSDDDDDANDELFYIRRRHNNNNEDPPPQPERHRRRRRGFRTLRQEEHQHAFSYKDAVNVLAPTFLTHYKTRYEQLNQEWIPLSSTAASSPALLEQEQHHHSLFLQETTHDDEEEEPPPQDAAGLSVAGGGASKDGIVRTDTAFHSSLFYLHHGRLLMRLPRDQVRLIMDPDLEPGVLSVEQWRPPPTNQGNGDHNNQHHHPHAADGGAAAAAAGETKLEDLPQLRYVLTIHSDLYQRIVSDMSNSVTKPYCGLSRCCHDNEKVDIRIAMFVLAIVLTLLLVNVLIFGATN